MKNASNVNKSRPTEKIACERKSPVKQQNINAQNRIFRKNVILRSSTLTLRRRITVIIVIITLINNKLRIKFTETICCNERFTVVRIADCLLVNVYFPCAGTTDLELLCEICLRFRLYAFIY